MAHSTRLLTIFRNVGLGGAWGPLGLREKFPKFGGHTSNAVLPIVVSLGTLMTISLLLELLRG